LAEYRSHRSWTIVLFGNGNTIRGSVLSFQLVGVFLELLFPCMPNQHTSDICKELKFHIRN